MSIGLVLILRRIIQKLQSMDLPTFRQSMLSSNTRLPSGQLFENVHFGNRLVEVKIHMLHQCIGLYCFGNRRLCLNCYVFCSLCCLRSGRCLANTTETFWWWRWCYFAFSCCMTNAIKLKPVGGGGGGGTAACILVVAAAGTCLGVATVLA